MKQAPFWQVPLTIDRAGWRRGLPSAGFANLQQPGIDQSLQVPRKSRPAPGRFPAQSVPGAHPLVFSLEHTSGPGVLPRRWEVRPGAAGSVPWWKRGRPHASAVLSQRVPSSPGARKARATPAPDPAQQARVCTWMSAGPTGMACSGAASEVAGPRAQPFPSRKRRGAWKTRGAPPRFPRHLRT